MACHCQLSELSLAEVKVKNGMEKVNRRWTRERASAGLGPRDLPRVLG